MTTEEKDAAGQSPAEEAFKTETKKAAAMATPASDGRAKRERKAPQVFKPEVKEKEA